VRQRNGQLAAVQGGADSDENEANKCTSGELAHAMVLGLRQPEAN